MAELQILCKSQIENNNIQIFKTNNIENTSNIYSSSKIYEMCNKYNNLSI